MLAGLAKLSPWIRAKYFWWESRADRGTVSGRLAVRLWEGADGGDRAAWSSVSWAQTLYTTRVPGVYYGASMADETFTRAVIRACSDLVDLNSCDERACSVLY